MKLSKLYSNKDGIFNPIYFNNGLNVVFAEIRLPENKNKDTHNLGKSTLGRVIDFLFLSKRDPRFFLFKHQQLFNDFVFFLEIELGNNSFITVKRGVEESSKVSFKKHKEKFSDFTSLHEDLWDHNNLSFDRAKEMLDGFLELDSIKPWAFRSAIGYFLRSQEDYSDVFQLRKFRSKDAHWKPYLSHVLGFNAQLIRSLYEKEGELAELQQVEKTIKSELNGFIEEISKVEGIFLLKKHEVEEKQALLDSFDFRKDDRNKTVLLVDSVDERIAQLNQERYSLNLLLKKVCKSLEGDKILFKTSEAEKLFNEAGILFPGQLKKDFDQLIAFNKAITEERSIYLIEERNELQTKISEVELELDELGRERVKLLSFIRNAEFFEKYKSVSRELVSLKADIESLERQKSHIHRLQELKAKIRATTEECRQLQSKIEDDVELQNSDASSVFSKIRLFFSEIVEAVINRKALISVFQNREGHLQFSADILDELGNTTSADDGHTYKKLLCIAFDLSVLRVYGAEKFPHFVYHDGVFESLDDRKKENLLVILRRYSGMGIQSVITLIDSDLPSRNLNDPVFSNNDIVVNLHDEGEQGRLFKMKTW